eukprot:m.124034 g.124034  ORF g.124034 m.124034 type:complete len:115 (-) comp16611_c0_seq4:170-514(-)
MLSMHQGATIVVYLPRAVPTARGFFSPQTPLSSFVFLQADHSFPQRYAQAYRSELAEFLDMVAENRLVPDEDTQRHVVLERVATAAELSWQRKRPVTLAELDEERAAKVALACA